jgi:hypothetical protein
VSDASAISTFSFAFSVTAPIFLMVLIGMALKRLRMITEEFIDTASKLVFNLGLPTLLFTSSATTDFSRLADMNLLVAMGLMTLTVFTLTQLTARWHVQQTRDEGVFVQGAFRGNLVITGLAFCANAYGEQGLAIAALPVAMTVVLYNGLHPEPQPQSRQRKNLAQDLARHSAQSVNSGNCGRLCVQRPRCRLAACDPRQRQLPWSNGLAACINLYRWCAGFETIAAY